MIVVFFFFFFFFNDTATTEIYTLSLHDALPISRTPSPVCCTSIWIFWAKDSASSCELACARIVAEIFTSRPDSPWTRTSPNLCSMRTDWLALKVRVLSKLRVTSSCGQRSPAKAGTATRRRTTASQDGSRRLRPPSLANFNETRFIAFPPRFLRACAVSPDTRPATRIGAARSKGSGRPGRGGRQWRYRGQAVFRGSWPAATWWDFQAAAWLPRQAYLWPERRRSRRVRPRRGRCSSREIGRPGRVS